MGSPAKRCILISHLSACSILAQSDEPNDAIFGSGTAKGVPLSEVARNRSRGILSRVDCAHQGIWREHGHARESEVCVRGCSFLLCANRAAAVLESNAEEVMSWLA